MVSNTQSPQRQQQEKLMFEGIGMAQWDSAFWTSRKWRGDNRAEINREQFQPVSPSYGSVVELLQMVCLRKLFMRSKDS